MSSTSSFRQPSRRVPLVSNPRDLAGHLGVIGLQCRVVLHLQANDGKETLLTFVVDSGASYSLIGLDEAINRGLPVPPRESELELPLQTASGLTSMRIRPGRIRAWWNEDLQGYPFDWPVLFRVGDALSVPPILGLGGIVKTCRWTFDGSFFPESPYGYLTLDDTR